MSPDAAAAGKPPVARTVPTTTELHGERRVDEYAWLRDRDDPAIVAYLEAENAHADAVMKPTEALQETLYAVMLGRIQETDQNVPYRLGGFFHYSRTEQGKQYPIHCRKKGSLEAPEEVTLDLNRLAEGKPFMALGAYQLDVLRRRFPAIEAPTRDDICYATQNRQVAVKALARRMPVILVIGSKNSSNSNRLAEVAQAAGARAYLIDDISQIDPAWLQGVECLGITAGASAPEYLVDEVVRFFRAQGATDIVEVGAITEEVSFALPPELVRDRDARRLAPRA